MKLILGLFTGAVARPQFPQLPLAMSAQTGGGNRRLRGHTRLHGAVQGADALPALGLLRHRDGASRTDAAEIW